MALFDNIVAEVYTVTARPDLIADTALAVKSATLKLHQSDLYAKDLVETGLEFVTPAFIQSLSYRSLFPRWRRLEFLRKYSNGVPGEFFTKLSPGEVLDSYGIHKENVAYLAGESLEIRSNTADEFMLLGFYENPILTTAEYNSWIALDHPYAIIFDAAKIVLAAIGLQERAAAINNMAAEQHILLKQNNLGVNS